MNIRANCKLFQGWIRTHRWGLVFAVFFGVMMLLPYALFPLRIGDRYQGIMNIVADDTLFYLARINDAMDGHLNLANAYLWEHKEGLPHQLFFVEDGLGMLYRISYLDVVTGFLVTTAIASGIATLLIYLIAHAILRSSSRAVFCTAFLMIGFFPLAFLRPVAPQVNMLFWLLQIYILLLCATRPLTRRLITMNALAFGLLFYVYPYYWMHLGVVYTLFIAYLWFQDRARSKDICVSAIGGFMLAIPYFLLSYKTSRLPEFTETIVRMGMLSTRQPGAQDVLIGVGLCMIGILILWKKKIRFTPEVPVLLIGAMGVAIAANQQVITGKEFFSPAILGILVLSPPPLF
ncbi:MAG: hypothetical protein NUV81_01825 [bacterium]|nr:hypothetical protein [bacterium]